jgi:hypothetical protein
MAVFARNAAFMVLTALTPVDAIMDALFGHHRPNRVVEAPLGTSHTEVIHEGPNRKVVVDESSRPRHSPRPNRQVADMGSRQNDELTEAMPRHHREVVDQTPLNKERPVGTIANRPQRYNREQAPPVNAIAKEQPQRHNREQAPPSSDVPKEQLQRYNREQAPPVSAIAKEQPQRHNREQAPPSNDVAKEQPQRHNREQAPPIADVVTDGLQRHNREQMPPSNDVVTVGLPRQIREQAPPSIDAITEDAVAKPATRLQPPRSSLSELRPNHQTAETLHRSISRVVQPDGSVVHWKQDHRTSRKAESAAYEAGPRAVYVVSDDGTEVVRAPSPLSEDAPFEKLVRPPIQLPEAASSEDVHVVRPPSPLLEDTPSEDVVRSLG